MFYLSGENNTIIDEMTSNISQNPHPGILKHSPDENINKTPENIKRKKSSKSNKQFDEKKEKGAAQIIVPSKLIFAGSIDNFLNYFKWRIIFL